jgi:DNA-binding transcriptional MocR family regulator
LAESEGPIRQMDASGGCSRLRPLALQAGTTAQAQVYATLRQSLMSGQLRPGEEISLRQAAAALGTSVTPVREALRQLESEGGLVVYGKNRTLRVPVITPEELCEIGDIRVQLEGLATQGKRRAGSAAASCASCATRPISWRRRRRRATPTRIWRRTGAFIP